MNKDVNSWYGARERCAEEDGDLLKLNSLEHLETLTNNSDKLQVIFLQSTNLPN